MAPAATHLISQFPAATSPWLIVGAIVAIACIFAWVVHGAVRALSSRYLEHQGAAARAIARRTSGIFRFALIVLAVSALLPLTPLSRGVLDEAHRFLLAAFLVLSGWTAIVSTNIVLDRYAGNFRVDVADNLMARKAITQVGLIKRVLDLLLVLLTAGFALMSFESVRQFGISLFASAGIAGITAGLAARPLLGNLIAGMQIAITQPIRLGDVLVIQGNWGTVEQISSTYVVLKIWDWRRYVVPLSYFFDNPFENWTRSSASLIGSVTLYADYTVSVDAVRARLTEIARSSPLWDGNVVNLQVTDASENAIELRALVSAADSGKAFDLRCEVREKLIAYLRDEHPLVFPRWRTEALAREKLTSINNAGTNSL